MRHRGLKMMIGLCSMFLVMSSCGTSLPQGDRGSIALVPFWNEEMGIQGVEPLQNWTEEAELVQASAPGTRDEMVAIVLEQTSLTQLPEPTGTHRGKAFAWDLWTAEVQLKDVGPQPLHMELALAEGDLASYLVALVVKPEVYEANPALYDSVFAHALYALEPLK